MIYSLRRAFFSRVPTLSVVPVLTVSTVSKEVKRQPFTINGTSFDARSIYLDMQATTPIDPRVLDKMLPYMLEQFGNAHSRTHLYGWESEEAVEEARQHVANLIGADPKEIIFTSGATESNNIVIKGLAKFHSGGGSKKKKNHIITCQTEHKCVLDSCRSLQQEGFEVTYLKPETNGRISISLLEQSIRPETLLVSIMSVNNEIGVIQPIKEIGELCRKKGVYFHTDAAQAVGKIPMNVDEMKIDCLSLSGHKIYAPKGIGAMYIRRKPRVRLTSIISGGGQERGFRSGTLPTPLIVGLGEACRVAKQEMQEDEKWITLCKTRLENIIYSGCTHVTLNGSYSQRIAGNLNLSFAAVEGESLMMAIKDIAVSSGSACTSSSLEPSYVLRAIGCPEDLAHTSLRIGIGRFTTMEEIEYTGKLIVEKVNQLRDLSPVWDLMQEGKDINSVTWN